ncbi:ferritin [Virgibacillus halotolerans]|uniref:DUF6414 family protein n=1 Tax=Virgibacillus halotolerans TaxID=1071053 RepID=UPI0019611DE1|nr:hypothetical protein [Virgibacillus halotolerans]MBM7598494.1 ferritin [Virgibacillus halotolerans]
MYRDFIYYDEEKVKSILAQLDSGLIESIGSESTHTGDIEGNVNTGVVAEMLGIKLGANGKYEYSKNNQSNKVLHDHAFSAMVDLMGKNLKDVSNLDRSQISNKSFVKISGDMKIYDYKDLSSMLGKWDKIGEIFNIKSESDDADTFQLFSEFITEVYDDLTIIELKNKKNSILTGLVKPKYLRETMRDLTFKYGTTPDHKWEMVCQITKIPQNKSQNIGDRFADFGDTLDVSKLNEEKSMSNFLNSFIDEFNKLYDVFASVGYPNIAVDPIGVYRIIE